MSKMLEAEEGFLRVIKTARTEKSINAAAKKGFRPLVKRVVPSSKIRSKFCIIQNRITGQIQIQGDYRAGGLHHSNWETVIEWTNFYPHQWPSPYAAYLIPPDIEEGEIVVLEDIIEDVIGSTWNQGDVYRLQSCRATWTGEDFVLDHNPDNIAEFRG